MLGFVCRRTLNWILSPFVWDFQAESLRDFSFSFKKRSCVLFPRRGMCACARACAPTQSKNLHFLMRESHDLGAFQKGGGQTGQKMWPGGKTGCSPVGCPDSTCPRAGCEPRADSRKPPIFMAHGLRLRQITESPA